LCAFKFASNRFSGLLSTVHLKANESCGSLLSDSLKVLVFEFASRKRFDFPGIFWFRASCALGI